jgi:hypothetical protein
LAQADRCAVVRLKLNFESDYMQLCSTRGAKKLLSIAILAITGLSLFPLAAHACPMCNQSIAEQNALPHAYMYSIIFMLTMPAVVFTGIGSFIVFQFRKAAAVVPPSDADADAAPQIEAGECEAPLQ